MRQGQNPNHSASRSIQWHQTLIHTDNRNGIQRLIHQPSQSSQPYLYIILLDTSGSMLNKQSLSQAKGVLQYYCESMYLQRDLLTVITFGNQQVDIIFDAKPAPKSAEPMLSNINGGGGTPLSMALKKVSEVSQRHKMQPQSLLVLTDGRVQEELKIPNLTMPITLLDMENEAVNLGKVKKLAQQLKAEYVHIDQLQEPTIAGSLINADIHVRIL